MRLNQFLAHNIPCSRRVADTLIAEGRVKVKHTKATFTTPFLPHDKIFVDGKLLKIKKQEHYTVIVYHKPKGELVSRTDDRGRKVIFDSLDHKFQHFTPIGRLDYASMGLLLLSDSKKVVDALMHSHLERTYLVKINGSVTQAMCDAFEGGLETTSKEGAHQKSRVETIHIAPMQASVLKSGRNYSKLKLTLQEGRNRELRRFFGHFKREVLDLKRVSFGFVSLNALPAGKTRYLNSKEYKHLHAFLNQLGEENG
ncbi:pseudouridine synthase [Helicobacter ailurogastricus]|uniref:Pseudouridine synthase n=1 Tax=Helicobacter ailurogastricus TaxID=1578720 RepID=A0A0K2X7Q6_9HELI|nr:pseudouridine synthase [Helicobacter ailurogastricus]CRF41115.1 Ribosomal large subunit pseudouridine synthase B [Helicobacter ailurogastricus]CRF42076.1 Ribosomal large subunit pseudouridine synthase B [Helicobacter ailurogastricus]CRF44955.1 Ribosomal large subunit pseudouridine synthase B [Helicobacter ailurogastricus]